MYELLLPINRLYSRLRTFMFFKISRERAYNVSRLQMQCRELQIVYTVDFQTCIELLRSYKNFINTDYG